MEKIIDLINLDKSDIKYSFRDKDFEKFIEFNESLDTTINYIVKCRIVNPDDLFTLLQVANVLDRQCITWELKIYYLMFHTEDHIKSDRCPFSLQIIANILKTMKYKCISIYDVYSDKLEVLLDNHKLFNLNLISFNTVTKDAIICFASPIALDKYYGSGMDALIIKDSFNIEIESKPDKPITSDDRIVLMEYKCSNAFWNKRIGQYLKEQYPEVKLDILIRQAVTNSKVVNDLLEVFDNVYITNSYKEYQNLPDRCHIIDICL